MLSVTPARSCALRLRGAVPAESGDVLAIGLAMKKVRYGENMCKDDKDYLLWLTYWGMARGWRKSHDTTLESNLVKTAPSSRAGRTHVWQDQFRLPFLAAKTELIPRQARDDR